MQRWYGYPRGDWDATKEHATAILRARAASGLPDPTISYSELGAQLQPISFPDPHAHAFHALLGEVSSDEVDDGRAMLSVLVVYKDGDKMPGPGFFELARAKGRERGDRFATWIYEFNAVIDQGLAGRA
jgi:hypothetical protein